MKRFSISFLSLALVAGIGGLIVGCDRQDAPSAAVNAEPLPEGLVVSSIEGEAIEVLAAKASAGEGDEVILRGVIGGGAAPFSADRAIFTLLDRSTGTCDKIPGDNCPTPWDACCEPAETLVANSATIQVTNPSGQPIKATLNGVDGIAPLKQVVVRGKVQSKSDRTIVINAESIQVVQ